jgi:hypothetical protein
MRKSSLAAIMAAALAAGSVSAAAQDVPPENLPIGRFVADVRGAFPRLKQNPAIATGLNVTIANLPTHPLGLVFGAHVYPVRLRNLTLGIGGEMLISRGSRTLGATATGAPPPVAVRARLSAISPQISFNFGARDGWSYISGGIGGAKYITEREDKPFTDPIPRSKAINYGGGARWFSKKHVALSVDLRFYAINPQNATATMPARPRMTLLVMSAGIAVK